jgi:hypothetical protein
MVRLPVSGIDVRLRPPDGHEDVLLAESPAGASLALDLIGRLASTPDGSPVDPRALAVADLEVVLVAIRRALLGDVLTGEFRCPVDACGGRLDVSFSLGDLIAHHRPRRPPAVIDASIAGWFVHAGDEGSFRLPDGDDLLAIDGYADPEAVLVGRCLRPPEIDRSRTRAWRGRVERAMEAMAPTLSSDLTATCPECGTAIAVRFDVLPFVLTELRSHALWVYDDVHRIAGRYGWSEDEILNLPRTRRVRYAELIRDEAA